MALSTTTAAGVGATFGRRGDTDSSSVPTYTTISNITTISGPSFTRETIDTTALDTSGGYRTFVTGFRDAGEITFTMNFYYKGFDIMKDDFEADTEANYQIVLPDNYSTTITFDGLVTAMPLTIPPDDTITCDVTIKVSGEVTVEMGDSSGAA